MKVIRSILWVLLCLAAGQFIYTNWGTPQDVIFWSSGTTNPYLVEWPVGFIASVFYLLGFVPMWIIHRGVKWRLKRRIKTLENAAKSVSVTSVAKAADMVSTHSAHAHPGADSDSDGVPSLSSKQPSTL